MACTLRACKNGVKLLKVQTPYKKVKEKNMKKFTFTDNQGLIKTFIAASYAEALEMWKDWNGWN